MRKQITENFGFCPLNAIHFYLQEEFEDTDYILDFELGTDKLGLSDALRYEDLTIEGDRNSLISYEDNRLAVVLGVASSDLSSDSFQNQA